MNNELNKLASENPLITLRSSSDVSQNFHLLTSSYTYKNDIQEKSKEDPLASLFEEIYYSHEPVVGLDAIPKILHVIWLGPNEYPAESIPKLSNWLLHHPDWELYFWTDREDIVLPHPRAIKKTAYVVDGLTSYFSKAMNYGEMSDFIRFSILYDFGGVYVDHDVNCLRRIDSITRSCNFMACCDIPPEHSASFIYLDPETGKEFKSSFSVATSLVASSPKHPAWSHVFAALKKDWDYYTNHPDLTPYQKTVQRTYLPLTRGILEYNPKSHPLFALLPSLFHAPVNAIKLGEDYFNKVEGWIFALNYYRGFWI